MTSKFGREYKIHLETNDGGTLTVENPFTIEFRISRNIYSSANSASFRILNLSQNSRSRVRKDFWDIGEIRKVKFEAGYDGRLATCYVGNINTCLSVRESTEVVTEIECNGGIAAYSQAQYSNTFKDQTSYVDVQRDMIKSLGQYGLEEGEIGVDLRKTKRESSFNGSTIDLLEELTDGRMFIDNQKINIISENEFVQDDEQITVVDAGAGLLETPRRESTFMVLNVLFEPRFFIGQKIRVKSEIDKSLNGDFKIVSLAHTGIISDVVGGQISTEIGCLIPKRS